MSNTTNATSTESDRHDESGQERDTPDDLFAGPYEWVNCQVSNDPPTVEGMPASLNTCNITQFFCSSSSTAADGTTDGSSSNNNNNNTTSTSSTVSIVIPYAYEVYYNPQADLMRDILPFLDESMLEHLATAMGLVSCRRRRRSRHLLNSTSFSQAQLDRFVGVTLDPMDAPNIFDTTCRSDPPTISSSNSTSSSSLESDAVSCRPIQGGLTVFAKLEDGQRRQRRLRALQTGGDDDDDDDQDGIRRTVLQFLQEAMSDDIFVVPSSIEKVVFIDNDDSTTGSSGGDTTTGGGGGGTTSGGGSNTNTDADASGVAATSSSASGSQNSKLGALEIGLIAGGGALLLLLILLCCCFCCCRRQRRRKQRQSRDNHSSSTDNRSVAPPAWNFHDEEDAQGILVGTAALAELDSLALQPQKGELLYVGDDKNSVSTSHSTAASSSNMNNKSSKAGTPLSSRDGTPSMDYDGNNDDDSLFEFEGLGLAFPAISRHPSDGAVSHIRSNEFVIASAQSQPPSTASLSTMVHANLGNRPPPSVASLGTTSSFGTLQNSTMTTGSVLTSFTTAVLRDAAYSTTQNSYDEEIMGITEGGEEGQEASAAAILSDDDDDSNYFKMARSTSDTSARRDLQMT